MITGRELFVAKGLQWHRGYLNERKLRKRHLTFEVDYICSGMEVLLLFPLFLLPMASTSDPTSCSKVEAIQRVASSASGRWYLMAVKNGEIMNEKNKQTKQAECSGYNSKPPCSCTIFDFNSAIPEPFIPEYNITEYSYNMRSEKYDVQNLQIKLVDNSTNMAIFEVISPGAESMEMNRMTVRGLATDDHRSFMLLHICMGEDPDAEMDVWFLSRSPYVSNYSMEGLHRALALNNMTTDNMRRVAHTECVYPPSGTNRNTQVHNHKFTIF